MTLRAPRIPPLVVVLVMLALQWVCAHFVPAARFVLPYSVGIATLLAAAGIAVALAGVLAFRRANTTVDPTRPQATSALVIRGVY